MQVPFTVYLGWLTVATIANVSVWLYAVQWNGLGISAAGWTITLLGVATMVSVTLSIKNADAIFPLVPLWAFVGIAVKQAAVPAVALTAAAMAAICAVTWVAIVVGGVGKRKPLAPRWT